MSLVNQPIAPSGESAKDIRIHSKETMVDDLAFFGRKVGPRRRTSSSQPRTHKEIENFCLRRLLMAMAQSDKHPLKFPVTVQAPVAGNKLPDFLLKSGDGTVIGVEVTAAGHADWHTWLSKTETSAGGTAHLLPGDGYSPEGLRKLLFGDIKKAIVEKLRILQSGGYSKAPLSDLLLYANSEGGATADEDDRTFVVDFLCQNRTEIEKGSLVFRKYHLIFGDIVFIDLFGQRERIDVSVLHGDDWSNWLQIQAEHLRNRSFNELDASNLADELESMARADRVRLAHSVRELLQNLLRWSLRDHERNADLKDMIDAYRDDVEEVLSENPSLEEHLFDLLKEQFDRARRKLATSSWAKKNAISEAEIPSTCPFRVDDLRDPGFLPG
ncbi:MAG: DUF29 domain-containing protein [Rhodospirillales bacterium]|nr:DUF29 domain-containing protein [Rhodospirillales bacterium]